MEHVQLFDDIEVSEDERSALLRLVDRALALNSSQGPAHYMVAGCGVLEDLERGDRDHACACALAKRLAAFIAPGFTVISIRILLSPPGSPAQPWHLDFAQDFSEVRTAFLAISPSSALNSTQILDFGDDAPRIAEMARTSEGPLPSEAWCDSVAQVWPITCSPWQLSMLRTSHAFHRRGENKSAFTRITFNVDMARLEESPNFVDLDMQRALNGHRLCSREVVDDLTEQDVCLMDDKELVDRFLWSGVQLAGRAVSGA